MISKDETMALKAISILTVILTHANGFSMSFVDIPILKNSIITSMFCQGGMCTFLILSGYGLYESLLTNGLSNFWDKKFKKIFVPAIIIQVLWSVLLSLEHYFSSGTMDFLFLNFTDIVCSSPYNQIDGSIWYLSFLLFCYICFYFAFNYTNNVNVGISLLFVIWIPSMMIIPHIWVNSFYCMSSFTLGVLFGHLSQKHALKVIDPYIRVSIIVLAMICTIYYYYHFRQNIIADNILSNLLAISFIAFFSFFNCKNLKVLNFLGRNSYVLYLLQGKIIFGFFPYNNYDSYIRLLVTILLFAITVAVAVAWGKIEKLAFKSYYNISSSTHIN